MLGPEKMIRVSIVGTKSVEREVVEKLYQLNMLHIVDFSGEIEEFKIGTPWDEASKYSEYLLKIRSINSFLGITYGKKTFTPKEILKKIEGVLENLGREVEELRTEKSKNEAELEKVKKFIEFKSIVDVLEIPIEIFKKYESLERFFGKTEKDVSEFFESEDILVFCKEYQKDRYACTVFAPPEYKDEVFRILKGAKFTEEEVPEEIIENPEEKKRITEERLEMINERIGSLREKHGDFLIAADEYFTMETQKAEVPLKFATSPNTFVVEGWVFEENFDFLAREITEVSKAKAYVEKLKMISPEDAPVAMKNPAPVKPSELLVKTFSVPKYGEIDPSKILYITFPFYYGFMLGDIGYGLLLMILGIALKKNWKNSFVWLSNLFTGRPDSEGLDKMLDIFIYYCCTISIIFGIIYGEFFGLEIFGENSAFGLTEFRTPLHRLHQVPLMIFITMTIGLIQMLLACFFGIINLSKHGIRKAIFEKLGWVLVMVLVYYVFFAYMIEFLPQLPLSMKNTGIILGVVILIALYLIFKYEGGIYLIEVFTLISNLFSYTRLLAIGLSSAGIALATNTMVEVALKSAFSGGIVKTIIMIILALIILIVFHIINLALGIIGPGIHSLRLQYVEFMPKFFEGGGREYSPFGYKKKYVEEG